MRKGRERVQHKPGAERAVNQHLERLSSLQLQLMELPIQCTLEILGSCVCQQVPEIAAALQEAAAAHAPLEQKLLLSIVRVLGFLGVALIQASHPPSVHIAAIQVLHR